MIKIILTFIFLIIAVTDILAIKQGKIKVRYFSKPLLMPLLAVLYALYAADVNCIIITALLLCFLGDVFLLKPDKKLCFMGGLVSFLAGHVFYVIVFLKSADYLRDVPGWFYAVLVLYAASGLVILNKLKPFLGQMKIPVLVYFLVIMTMSFTSLARVYSAGGPEFWLPFAGSLFFMLSDSVLAFQVFKSESTAGGIAVMSTYILAQVLIVSGFII